ncbi:Golgi-associated PDZ and coiled-coil motif-containing protein-like isoform X2 [Varroa destructor]|uniref:PDZ domain-containing protein n=1 Tax=Varroa destructor TaxID=109461 RepID=A0A7M7JT99_VARDE|nr:Golgi-associated PDZ and coiled-coil motif-containing protein-like isoform X2 [Varroa destructor]
MVYIELDSMLGDLEEKHQPLCYQGRERLSAMCAAFGQLVHKALAVGELNVKLQAQLDETKGLLYSAESARVVADKEARALLARLQAAQLEASRQRRVSSDGDAQAIQAKLEEDLKQVLEEVGQDARQRAELVFLRAENDRLRKILANNESELVGAKLAAKYLDKELAGRIQQIQLLNGNLKPAEQDRLWSQLQSEIRLHRHKMVIRACRARLNRLALEEERARAARMPPSGEVRRVVIYKAHNEGLGISITGGREHRVPIVVSEVHPHMAAWRSGQLFVGDAVLAVNDIDIRQCLHDEAVEILSRQEGSVELDLLWIDEHADKTTQEQEARTEAHDAMMKYHFFLPKDLAGGDAAEVLEENGSIASQETKSSSPKTDVSVKGSDSGSLD